MTIVADEQGTLTVGHRPRFGADATSTATIEIDPGTAADLREHLGLINPRRVTRQGTVDDGRRISITRYWPTGQDSFVIQGDLSRPERRFVALVNRSIGPSGEIALDP